MNKQKTLIVLIIIPFVYSIGWSQIIDIPDINFKNALLNTNCADFNGDGNFTSQVDLNNDDEIQLSEILGIQGLSVVNKNITSLEGIENFVDLTYLNVQFNDLQTMDISALTNLRSLLCDANELIELNVSSNVNLEELYCSENLLTALDVTLNTNLINLEFFLNQLSDIDISFNTNLETLNSSVNPLSTLDVSNNIQLKSLTTSHTNFSVLDLSNNVLLEYLSADHNNLTAIDLSENLNLIVISLSNNLLSEIDVSNNSNVFELNVQNNDLIYANIKNGIPFTDYSGFFGNPNLEFICANDFEVSAVQAELDALGYTETIVSDDCSLSINDYAIVSETKVFPIPLKDELNLQSEHQINHLTIFNSNGQIVFEEEPSDIHAVVKTNQLLSGFYIIKIETSKGVEIKNIIKQ
ncbi:T9SS type A sorting domain-containing protein [Winogradskyella psychrotolerans]|uniref:T9SS type A sorting domain-containing protein n=1 Tax=Winogradskyella psychrotolerans TaxID=1344585 RepID=UPI001C0753CF|nr:T9SS type A sorting domain-containing protein [Winogradskyella psychrotolerans]MBU2920290.1 T9SS type A sorting domain-containing protein [Winogradskyella psychrotolerans]